MFEKTQSFDMNDQNYESVQQKVENILKLDLNYSIHKKKLGETLIRINYYDDKLNKGAQKENRITILQEPERKIYIQIKGKLRDDQVDHLWMKLIQDLNLTREIKEKEEILPSREDIIYQIIELIKLRGYTISLRDAQDFLDNFYSKYRRLPKNEEINSIVKGYIIMVNEDYLLHQFKSSIQTEAILETEGTIIEGTENKHPLISNTNSMVMNENSIGRKKCPSCGNDGLIHELDDRNIILLDYPRIYGKKNCCAECGYEWRG